MDNVVEAIGNADLLRASIEALATRGSVAVVGAPPYGVEVSLDVHRLLPGRRVLGVCEGDSDPEQLIPLLAGLVESGRLPIAAAGPRVRLRADRDRGRDFAGGQVTKAVLRFDD